jgi:PAS domain-containing protein
MGTPRENAAEEVTRLRDCMDDLASTLALQSLWTSGERPQIVSSLLEAVLGRTSELIAANERLKKEVAELRTTEEALRANELNFQLTVDSMPGMVHTMTATGAVEFVNHQILDFFGKTVEELNSWDTRLHPDDRSRVIDLWTHSVATGERRSMWRFARSALTARTGGCIHVVFRSATSTGTSSVGTTC